MTNTPKYSVGQRVRFTSGPLGTIDPATTRAGSMTEHLVQRGEMGTVAIDDGTMPDGWIAVTPDNFPDEYAPVSPGMIEAA